MWYEFLVWGVIAVVVMVWAAQGVLYLLGKRKFGPYTLAQRLRDPKLQKGLADMVNEWVDDPYDPKKEPMTEKQLQALREWSEGQAPQKQAKKSPSSIAMINVQQLNHELYGYRVECPACDFKGDFSTAEQAVWTNQWHAWFKHGALILHNPTTAVATLVAVVESGEENRFLIRDGERVEPLFTIRELEPEGAAGMV